MRLDSSSKKQRLAISLTPLIDVVFILLLFFMLTSRFEHYQSLEVNLASTDLASSGLTHSEVLRIHLHSDFLISINSAAPIEVNQLATSDVILDAITQEYPVRVSTDEDVTLSSLTQVMDLLSTSGVSSISLQGRPSP